MRRGASSNVNRIRRRCSLRSHATLPSTPHDAGTPPSARRISHTRSGRQDGGGGWERPSGCRGVQRHAVRRRAAACRRSAGARRSGRRRATARRRRSCRLRAARRSARAAAVRAGQRGRCAARRARGGDGGGADGRRLTGAAAAAPASTTERRRGGRRWHRLTSDVWQARGVLEYPLPAPPCSASRWCRGLGRAVPPTTRHAES